MLGSVTFEIPSDGPLPSRAVEALHSPPPPPPSSSSLFHAHCIRLTSLCHSFPLPLSLSVGHTRAG